uniref:PTTG1 interacting protein n=1 Tax=Amphilophus citrinellus TaxID=61819 RepID=A0A3Q0RRJ3_AMPCI
MPSFSSLGHTLTTSLLVAAVFLCVSFVTRGQCQTTSPPPTRKYRLVFSSSPAVFTACLWCFATNNCTEYPVSWLLPPATLCPLSQARWGVCWMNFEALIIAMAVLGGAILIGIVVCCCCCCCCRKSRPSREEERSAKRREEIKQRAEER